MRGFLTFVIVVGLVVLLAPPAAAGELNIPCVIPENNVWGVPTVGALYSYLMDGTRDTVCVDNSTAIPEIKIGPCAAPETDVEVRGIVEN